jgi:polysaccharide export outer membrane protein
MKIRTAYRHFLLFAIVLTSVVTASAQVLQHRRYQLHAGDQIKVEYTYTSDLNETLTIQPDGYVVLNTGGSVLLAGKTLEQATDAVREKVSARLSNPVVTLTLTDFQKPYFIVSGEVPNPARYDLREQTTALRAVMLAGGITKSGKEKQVIVFHNMDSGEQVVRTLNLKGVEKQDIFEHDMELSSGDIVYVPRTKLSRLADVATVAASLGLYLNAATYLSR